MKLSEVFPLSYLVNLDRRPDRLKQANEEFDKLDFHPERFSAIENVNGAAGCYLSHLEILKKARAKKKSVLIFEDDVMLVGDYKSVIEQALDELQDLDWDMFYLGGNVLKPVYQITEHIGKLTHCQSTHAYGVNYKFLDILVPFIEQQKYIVDVLYADGVIPVRNCFITIPMVAIQRSDYSDIEKTIMTYDVPVERFNHFLVKKQ